MPAPLIDLSKIDLQKIEFDREAIARVLPHRDVMAVLDGVNIVHREEQFAVGYVDVHDGMFWAKGHFPGNPLLPGVLLVEAAAQLSSFGYKIIVPDQADRLMVFGGAEHVRFRGTVRPGNRVHVISKVLTRTMRVSRSSTQAFVGDRLVYEGEVLGINT